MRRVLFVLGVVGAGGACSGSDPAAPAGTFYLSGTVTYAANGAPFEAAIAVGPPLGDAVAETRSSPSGRYELTFYDTECRKGAFMVSASASGGGYYPAQGTLPCTAKGSPYVVDLKMVLRDASRPGT
jgi:hypothetical protein